MKHSLLIAAIAASSLSLTANAGLQLRGDLMAYDDVLDITWLLDANYANTSGYDGNDGEMTWSAAKAWAAQLTITDAEYGEVSGWRLPSARLQTPVNYNLTYDGSSDFGWNNTRSELGHMFFNNLGNKAPYDVSGNSQSGYGVTNTTYTDANGCIAIQNLQNSVFWNDEADERGFATAWVFFTVTGAQGNDNPNRGSDYYAWVVRDGDVAPVNDVPVPAAAWLFGSAILGLAGARRKK